MGSHHRGNPGDGTGAVGTGGGTGTGTGELTCRIHPGRAPSQGFVHLCDGGRPGPHAHGIARPQPLETMNLQHACSTCDVAIVTFAPLASKAPSGDSGADWPGAGQLFVGTNCPAATPEHPAQLNEVVRVIEKAANRLRRPA
jgi:hypothetical protein